MTRATWIVMLTLAALGCGGDDATEPAVVLDLSFDLADAAGAGYPVTRVAVTFEGAKSPREFELTVGATTAEGSITGLEPGAWIAEAAVFSSGLCLARGAREIVVAEGGARLELDFVAWNRLFPDLPRRVLFIGHSHTLANGGLDVHFAAMANDFDPRWNVTAAKVAYGGWSLGAHWNDPMQTARSLLADEPWDAVVLHGSIALLEDHASFTANVGNFAALARNEYVDPWLIMNWAPPGSVELTDEIASRVDYTSRAASAPVSPLGLAWREVVQTVPELELFVDAAGHPTVEGTQLAASCLFASLFGVSPQGGGYVVDGRISEDERDAIQAVAWSVCGP